MGNGLAEKRKLKHSSSRSGNGSWEISSVRHCGRVQKRKSQNGNQEKTERTHSKQSARVQSRMSVLDEIAMKLKVMKEIQKGAVTLGFLSPSKLVLFCSVQSSVFTRVPSPYVVFRRCFFFFVNLQFFVI